MDLTVKLAGYIYVIEMKLRSDRDPELAATGLQTGREGGNAALAQIQARGYSAKYRAEPGKGLFEVGLIFSPRVRNLVQADWRRVD